VHCPNEQGSNGEKRDDDQGGYSGSAGAGSGRKRIAQPWGISFLLFLLGFVLLVVLGKLNLSRLTADVLRVLAAGLCIAAFLIARRGQKAAR
jgi:hypothetical protein